MAAVSRARSVVRLSALLRESGIEGILDSDPRITGISYDSRRTVPGDLFVAVPGFRTDGRRFIPEALTNGAVAVVAEGEPGALAGQAPVLTVPSARAALARL